jgi:predicted LPLAT superfamily acyltransferase
LFCLKRQTQYHVYFEKFSERLDFRQRKRRPQILDAAVQVFADRLQHHCLQAPLQWFNFFPFWRDECDNQAGAQQ